MSDWHRFSGRFYGVFRDGLDSKPVSMHATKEEAEQSLSLLRSSPLTSGGIPFHSGLVLVCDVAGGSWASVEPPPEMHADTIWGLFYDEHTP